MIKGVGLSPPETMPIVGDLISRSVVTENERWKSQYVL